MTNSSPAQLLTPDSGSFWPDLPILGELFSGLVISNPEELIFCPFTLAPEHTIGSFQASGSPIKQAKTMTV